MTQESQKPNMSPAETAAALSLITEMSEGLMPQMEAPLEQEMPQG